MKMLNIIASAYRATIEEQDDTIVWLSRAMKNAGAEVDVLLRGNAVNYAVQGQDASGLAFGGWRQTEPPRIAHELEGLIGKGTKVYALADDLAERGLTATPLLAGVEAVPMRGLAALCSRYDRVWHW